MAWLFNLLDMATFVTDFQIKIRTRNKGAVLIRLLKLPSVYLITGTRNQQAQTVGAVVLWYPGERSSGAKSWVLVALRTTVPVGPGLLQFPHGKSRVPGNCSSRWTGLLGHLLHSQHLSKHFRKCCFWSLRLQRMTEKVNNIINVNYFNLFTKKRKKNRYPLLVYR